jgi:hypothetical protein
MQADSSSRLCLRKPMNCVCAISVVCYKFRDKNAPNRAISPFFAGNHCQLVNTKDFAFSRLLLQTIGSRRRPLVIGDWSAASRCVCRCRLDKHSAIDRRSRQSQRRCWAEPSGTHDRRTVSQQTQRCRQKLPSISRPPLPLGSPRKAPREASARGKVRETSAPRYASERVAT